MKIGVVSLGCPKNLVDSEVMLGLIATQEYSITNDPAEAELIIVNTCGFIESAKEESINTILQMGKYKEEGQCKYLIVTGCLGQRYAQELFSDLPEVDAILGTECYKEIPTVIQRVVAGERFILVEKPQAYSQTTQRYLTTPKHFAYLKIAEGCDNCCSYCAIPAIRGPYRSRPYEEIIAEAKQLVESGVKEIILVAQDTSRYGEDLYGKLRLPELLRDLNALKALHWVRILYCYPQYFTDELIETIATCDKVCKYVDLPLQHASDELLASMNRHDTQAAVSALLAKLRLRIPNICIRTTFIVGFPGETEEQFQELMDFVEKERFNCAGVFKYSQEEGTVAGARPDQIAEEIKEERFHQLMALQAQVSEELQQEREDSVVEVVIEGFDSENADLALARSQWEAPEIDGRIFVERASKYQIGEYVQVRISQGFTYEVVAEPIK